MLLELAITSHYVIETGNKNGNIVVYYQGVT